MALSRIEVANRALDAVGVDRLASLDQGGKAANLCNAMMPVLRDGLLRRHPWNFAKGRANLPALVGAPAWGYTYRYQLPADCLRVLRLNVTDPTTAYKIEGGLLLTDAGPPLGISYIKRIEDPGLFDALFAEVLIKAIARDLAKPMANDTALRQVMAKEFDEALRDARSANAAEGLPDTLWSDTLLNARLI